VCAQPLLITVVCKCIIWKALCPYVLDARLWLWVSLKHACVCCVNSTSKEISSSLTTLPSDMKPVLRHSGLAAVSVCEWCTVQQCEDSSHQQRTIKQPHKTIEHSTVLSLSPNHTDLQVHCSRPELPADHNELWLNYTYPVHILTLHSALWIFVSIYVHCSVTYITVVFICHTCRL